MISLPAATCSLILALAAAVPGPLPQDGRLDRSRPLAGEGPTTVELAVHVLDVDDVDSANQSFEANIFYEYRWQDPRLAHEGQSISLPLSSIWNPVIQIVNQQRLQFTLPDVAEVESNGEVRHQQRVWGSFSQPLALAEFPFDRQELTILMICGRHTVDEVVLIQDDQVQSGIAEEFSLADWVVLDHRIEQDVFQAAPGDESVHGYSLTIELERRTGYYWLKIILPLVLIVCMSWVVFWIDPTQSGTQISVAVTTMLTLIAYRFATDALLPRVSYLTRLDAFIMASTVLVFASLAEVVWTARLAESGQTERARRVDRYARVVFPTLFAICFLKALVF